MLKSNNRTRVVILIFLILLTLSVKAFSGNKLVYNVMDYGAKNSRSINSQVAIQKAVDACAKAGGGTVLIPAGHFSTATIRLKDHVNFHLENGAFLYAVSDSTLYKNDKEGLEDAGDSFIPSLIVAKKLNNISITGQGSIIGQPEFYYSEITWNDTYPGWNENARSYAAAMNRPWVKDPKISLIYISECQNILIKDVNIINSPNWSCHIQWSRDIFIQGITILSSLEEGVNSDGLDIDGCKNVLVSDCIIRTGDDAICLKTTRQGKRSETCEDVVITNCTLSSSSCALKIGTETYSDFNRISFTNCTISKTNRAIGIIVRDGAVVNQVTFSNILLECSRRPIFWWGDGEAFHFNVLKRNQNSKVGKIQNVIIENISGDVQGSSSIKGCAGDDDDAYSSISNVRLSKISLNIRPEIEKDERTVNTINIEHAQNISLKDIRIIWDKHQQEKLWKHGLYINEVKGFDVQEFNQISSNIKSIVAAIHLNHTIDGWLVLNHLNNADLLCSITGNKTNNIVLNRMKNGASVIISNEAKKNVKIME